MKRYEKEIFAFTMSLNANIIFVIFIKNLVKKASQLDMRNYEVY